MDIFIGFIEREGETSIYCSTYLCILWLILVCAPDRGLNLQPWWIGMMLWPAEVLDQNVCSLKGGIFHSIPVFGRHCQIIKQEQGGLKIDKFNWDSLGKKWSALGLIDKPNIK